VKATLVVKKGKFRKKAKKKEFTPAGRP